MSYPRAESHIMTRGFDGIPGVPLLSLKGNGPEFDYSLIKNPQEIKNPQDAIKVATDIINDKTEINKILSAIYNDWSEHETLLTNIKIREVKVNKQNPLYKELLKSVLKHGSKSIKICVNVNDDLKTYTPCKSKHYKEFNKQIEEIVAILKSIGAEWITVKVWRRSDEQKYFY